MEPLENAETLFKIYFSRFALLATFGSIFLGLGGIILALAYRIVKRIITSKNIFDEYP